MIISIASPSGLPKMSSTAIPRSAIHETSGQPCKVGCDGPLRGWPEPARPLPTWSPSYQTGTMMPLLFSERLDVGNALAGPDEVVPGIDTNSAQSARIWNHWLGGKDNFAADRAAADAFAEIVPAIACASRCSRNFQLRLVRYLVAEAGIGQFLDVGMGLPAVANTHEIAQEAEPEARVAYVDPDPMVINHGRALLTSTATETVGYVQADARDTGTVLAEAAGTLDLGEPMAVLLLNMLHLFGDEEAQAIVAGLAAPLAAGSHVAIVDLTDQIHGEAVHRAARAVSELGGEAITVRTPARIAGFLDGLELLDPGPVSCTRWRPETDLDRADEVDLWCAVARKPGRPA